MGPQRYPLPPHHTSPPPNISLAFLYLFIKHNIHPWVFYYSKSSYVLKQLSNELEVLSSKETLLPKFCTHSKGASSNKGTISLTTGRRDKWLSVVLISILNTCWPSGSLSITSYLLHVSKSMLTFSPHRLPCPPHPFILLTVLAVCSLCFSLYILHLLLFSPL